MSKKQIQKLGESIRQPSWKTLLNERTEFTQPTSITETNNVLIRKTSKGKKVNKYSNVKLLGRGAFGKVKLVQKDGILYATKKIKKSRLRRKTLRNTSQPDNDVMKEIAIMKKLNHPNIVQLYEVMDDGVNGKHIFLVMEYVSGGNLHDAILKQKGTNLELCRRWFRELIIGLNYLHKNCVIHRDIKPLNLLLTPKGVIKICDFGVSHVFVKNDKLKKTQGSPAFYSPEVCAGEEYSGIKTDIWAVGVTLYFMIFKKLPFTNDDIIELYNIIINDPLVFPIEISKDLKSLLCGMLEKNPEKRFTLEQIFQHPWVCGKKKLLNIENVTPVTVTLNEISTAITNQLN
ncbi:map/microtubule affinity-regulating kinase [Anaeramoeba flamelloides]|uniref:Map/microtubule affinity-regulating kinase n=1 Tax=Anaeramoeba flamelloides TaxID=1746091 RepID=A0ABQ8YT48_9EUKA|nr:map/microtubule affinity-regulating kinase [Anaeramoeba flamelloides]